MSRKTHVHLHRQHTQMHLTWFDLAESDRGLIGVCVSGWADLKRPWGLVQSRRTDMGLESPSNFASSFSPSSHCYSTRRHTHKPYSPIQKASVICHTVPNRLCLWLAWILNPHIPSSLSCCTFQQQLDLLFEEIYRAIYLTGSEWHRFWMSGAGANCRAMWSRENREGDKSRGCGGIRERVVGGRKVGNSQGIK